MSICSEASITLTPPPPPTREESGGCTTFIMDGDPCFFLSVAVMKRLLPLLNAAHVMQMRVRLSAAMKETLRWPMKSHASLMTKHLQL